MENKELSIDEVRIILDKQNKYFNTQITKDIDFRINQLKKLKEGMKKYEDKINEALYLDLGKNKNESYMTEVGLVYSTITHIIKNLKKWAKPERRKTPFYLMPSRSFIISEPYGAVLVISPYNYPVELLLEPLAGAIAAGNTVILKPSEIAPNVSKVMKEMISETFEEEYIACVEGGIETNTALLSNKFDYIFFTGSPTVGKVVMEAAAKNLTPVTLELGGKSPVIVDDSANIKEAAKRIIWGKTLNAGQTCVAPDYLMVKKNVKDQLVNEMKNAIYEFFGDNIEESNSFGRIINDKHFNRIKGLIEKDKEGIVFGGSFNEEKRYIEPTIIEISSLDAATMGEEIFGPVLPVLCYENLDEAIKIIKKLTKPLALYLFTTQKDVEQKVLSEISSGGVCINDTITHLANSNIPFGGVGNSGMGSYHGKNTFTTFSHKRSVLKKPSGLGFGGSIMYPEYTEKQLNLVKKIFK
ncbi:MAG TPA: aldehyde dehydrogenase [Clostridium sp.]|nr:aldehyde dehydrogenase [Clostridium sp.]